MSGAGKKEASVLFNNISPDTLVVGEGRNDRVVLLVSAITAGIATVVYLALAIILFRIGALDQYNTFFDADPSARLEMLAHGWPGGDGHIHPNLPNFFSVPITLAGLAIEWIGLSHDQIRIRQAIGLVISPLAVGAAVFVFGAVLALLAVQPLIASVAVVIFAFSLTSLLFGALPESFGLSLLVITASFYVLTRIVCNRDVDAKTSLACFTVLIFLSGSITISNVAITGLLGLVAEFARTNNLFVAVKRMVLAGIIGVAAIFAVAGLFVLVRGVDPHTGHYLYFVDKWLVPDWVANAVVRMPSAFANSLAPSGIHTRPSGFPGQPIEIEFTMEAPNLPNFVGIVILVFVLASALRSMRSAIALRPVLIGALAIMIYNWVFHSFWGTDLILYSAHWLTALMIAVAIGLNHQAHRRWFVPVAGIAAVGIIAINLFAISGMISEINVARHGLS